MEVVKVRAAWVKAMSWSIQFRINVNRRDGRTVTIMKGMSRIGGNRLVAVVNTKSEF